MLSRFCYRMGNQLNQLFIWWFWIKACLIQNHQINNWLSWVMLFNFKTIYHTIYKSHWVSCTWKFTSNLAFLMIKNLSWSSTKDISPHLLHFVCIFLGFAISSVKGIYWLFGKLQFLYHSPIKIEYLGTSSDWFQLWT